ncbi:MAG: hypothetical protein ACI8WB_002399, partial [Phenylobacterium sp.]
YYLALLDLTTHNGIYTQFSQKRIELEKQLSHEQIVMAMEQSQALVNRVSANGYVYRIPVLNQ